MLLKLVADKLYARQRSASSTETTAVFRSFLEHEEKSRESTPFDTRSDSGYTYGQQAEEQSTHNDYRLSDLICQFCRKLMTNDRKPLLLQCGHSFCESCITLLPIFGRPCSAVLHQESLDAPPKTITLAKHTLPASASSTSLFVLCKFLY